MNKLINTFYIVLKTAMILSPLFAYSSLMAMPEGEKITTKKTKKVPSNASDHDASDHVIRRYEVYQKTSTQASDTHDEPQQGLYSERVDSPHGEGGHTLSATSGMKTADPSERLKGAFVTTYGGVNPSIVPHSALSRAIAKDKMKKKFAEQSSAQFMLQEVSSLQNSGEDDKQIALPQEELLRKILDKK